MVEKEWNEENGLIFAIHNGVSAFVGETQEEGEMKKRARKGAFPREARSQSQEVKQWAVQWKRSWRRRENRGYSQKNGDLKLSSWMFKLLSRRQAILGYKLDSRRVFPPIRRSSYKTLLDIKMEVENESKNVVSQLLWKLIDHYHIEKNKKSVFQFSTRLLASSSDLPFYCIHLLIECDL